MKKIFYICGTIVLLLAVSLVVSIKKTDARSADYHDCETVDGIYGYHCSGEGGPYSGVMTIDGYTVDIIGSSDYAWAEGNLWNALARGGYYACSNGASAIRVLSGPTAATAAAVVPPCTDGAACTSDTANVCGETNGTFSCSLNLCLPPSDDDCPSDMCPNIPGSQSSLPPNTVVDSYGNCTSGSYQTCPDGTIKPLNGPCISTGIAGMCPDGTTPLPGGSCSGASCIGPDGVMISSGQKRTYYDPSDCKSFARLCYNGKMGGAPNFSNDTCVNGGSGGAIPVISTFQMNPDTVENTDSCTMLWAETGADVCTITGANLGAGHNAPLPSGSQKTPAINNTTPYTLTCSNTAGTATKQAVCYLNPNIQEN